MVFAYISRLPPELSSSIATKEKQIPLHLHTGSSVLNQGIKEEQIKKIEFARSNKKQG